MSATPRVAAVILTYNGLELTLGALASLEHTTWPNFEVVVVDNGSREDLGPAIRARFPNVEVVRTEQNLGPAGGYNLGFRHVLARPEVAYVLVLNDDVEVGTTMVAELVAVAERDPSIGAVGPKTFFYADRTKLASAGGRIVFRETVTKERGFGEVDTGRYERDEQVGYVNGCGMLARREAFEAAGLWDPTFFLSVEDADWCRRIAAQGFSTWYAHRAILHHMVSDTTGVYTPKKTFQTGRSAAIFVRRYATWWQWLTFLGGMVAALPIAWVRELRRGNQAAAVAKAKGVWAGLKVPPTSPPTL